ncbi:LPXTG cell wall anchor domain-containing protein [Streptomyces rubiginosohelvolus]|uniref:LPXTG cell wall anchor domain-containing protein n=1 Tax=Streptomyces rubiginosohelvolus TaxID=67362 RepID=UPI0033F6EF29
MMIRRVLATAVALAVTTPAALLSASPAYADAKATAQTPGRQSNPAIDKLKAATAEAQKAYDKASQAKADGAVELAKTLGELDGAHPLAVALAAAKRAAKDAATTKKNADQTVTDAKTALDTLAENATEEERGAAATTLSKAEAAEAAAATAKAATDATVAEAQKKVDDARGAAIRTHGVLDKAVDDARAVKVAADAALAKATKEAEEEEEGEDCEVESGLTAEVNGLPDKLVAGTTTTFSVRVTNGSDRHMDEVIAYTGVHATDSTGLKDTSRFFRLQWSTTSSTQWQNLNKDSYIDGVGALKAGAHADVKLRLTLDKTTPAGNGVLFIAADFYNKDGVCGGTPGADMYEFDINAAGDKPGTTPSQSAKPATGSTGITPQGSSSGAPATTGMNDSLATTGSSSPTASIALAGGAAVLLGAAAVFVVRRRKTGGDA